MLDQIFESWYKKFPPSVSKAYDKTLHQYSSYFVKLKLSEKERFKLRLFILLKSLSFKTEPNFEVTEEMKIIIGSAIVQLTFGLERFIFRTYRNIFVAPRSYTYRDDNRLMAGDVNTEKNTLSLSWPAVKRGFLIDDDADNIALHEASHCLILENGNVNFFGNFLEAEKLKAWEEVSSEEMKRLRTKKNSILDEYAGSNLMEMFSVSVETFFEKPTGFKTEFPLMFGLLCELLGQNPLLERSPCSTL